MPEENSQGRRPWLDVSSLMIEVTRRCNLDCDHCLRGDAENADMNARTLDTFLRHVKRISTVTFSGGEPSLNIPLIREFYRLCDKYDIPVYSFFVATNGMANQEELTLLLLDRYAKLPDAECRANCGVALSVDLFHEGAAWRCTEAKVPSRLVTGLAFYTDQKSHEDQSDLGWILPRGRAYENGLAERTAKDAPDTRFVLERCDDGVQAETLYLSANGRLYPDCDLSYEDMDAARDCPSDCPTMSIPVTECLEDCVMALLGPDGN